MVGQAKLRATQIRPKAVAGGIFGRFSNFDKCRLEAAGEVISGLIVDPTDWTATVKFGDSMSNRSRDIQLPHFVANDDDDDNDGPYDNMARRRLGMDGWALNAFGAS